MKRLLKKAGLAFLFLQVLVLNQAYADGIEQGIELLVGLGAILANLPTLAALIVLYIYRNNIKTAVILVGIIWLCYVLYFIRDLEGAKNTYDNSDEPILLAFWLPITLVFAFTLFLFIIDLFIKKSND